MDPLFTPKGHVVLERITLKEDAFQRLLIPVRVKHGTVLALLLPYFIFLRRGGCGACRPDFPFLAFLIFLLLLLSRAHWQGLDYLLVVSILRLPH